MIMNINIQKSNKGLRLKGVFYLSASLACAFLIL